MGTAFLYGNGGGGSGGGLNFQVVGGTTAPSNPKENTIWVNTDVKITCWYFQAEQPENMIEGEIWFTTSTSSPVEFNALKKNCIPVYPVSAKQYVNGGLVDVSAMSYRNSEWVDWIIYVINNGVDNTAVTGGWSFVNIYNGQANSASVSDGAIRISRSESFGLYKWEYMTNNAIDLTDVETIELICEATANGSGYMNGEGYANMYFNCKSNVAAGASASVCLVNQGSISKKTITLDVSNLKGKYCLSVFAQAYADRPNISIAMYNLVLK